MNENGSLLGVGDIAPPLVISTFIRGDASVWERTSAAYIVEFWATWCGPCRDGLKQLSEIAQRYPIVSTIAISIWEDDPAAVSSFIDRFFPDIHCAIATDLIPPNTANRQGIMAQTWMAAAGQLFIPCAFLLNSERRIVWFGHSAGVMRPLQQYLSGDANIQTFADECRNRTIHDQRQITLERSIVECKQRKDYLGALASINELLAWLPDLENEWAVAKVIALWHTQGKTAAIEYGDYLIQDVWHESPVNLSRFAWTLYKENKLIKDNDELVQLFWRAKNTSNDLIRKIEVARRNS